mmetsp:Transcript_23506/g.39385  ORF Transcript_23506/g.39385 Transcript_23506/m.39385 type:complete len:193 (+) Transcript_23506:236-814(+)|eukprot:CAMPEP_0198209394 /NCGR_PEP_ID=MMETSP1445-20131203/15442_1 /TAXON_ID=36898 /ORGANISM="Pyramimonas sp., Strain CCMP2087" /LENGTH=192 /DNA_ID=CAMNT_0043883161 /DNA_START=156 /DNA_END=734 /DNA_ORIENTATION=-
MNSKQLPAEATECLEKFENALSSIEKNLQPLLGVSSRQLESQLKPLERAELHVTLAFAANALFGMYLKTQGVPMAEHPVKRELDRVQMYQQKVERAKFTERPRTGALNVDAANRFITHSIPDLSADQKKRLREINQRERTKSQDQDAKAKTPRQKSITAKEAANAFLEEITAEDSAPVATEGTTPKAKKSRK